MELLQRIQKKRNVDNMQFRKRENQSWAEVTQIVDRYWSGSTEPNFLEEIDNWSRAKFNARSDIQKNTAGMSPKDKETQTQLQWERWLKSNPKPLIVDQQERFNKSRGITKMSENDISKALAEWDNDAINKGMDEFMADSKKKQENDSSVEEFLKLIKSKSEKNKNE